MLEKVADDLIRLKVAAVINVNARLFVPVPGASVFPGRDRARPRRV
jgi:hypothetical protein